MNSFSLSQQNPKARVDVARGEATVRDESHVIVSMTLGQARATLAALDLFGRIGLGQIDEIAMLVRMGEIPMRADANEPKKMADNDTCDRIEDLLHQVKALLGFSRSSSNGVGNPHNSVDSMRAYEIQKTLARAVATRPDTTTPLMSVDRDGLGPRYTTDVAPEARWIEIP